MPESPWNNSQHPALPPHAELMFSGVRAQVYQWDQVLYDGSITRFERIRYLDGAFVIPILPNGRILLTRQQQPWRAEFISLPWGAIDSQDLSPQEWAKRELREETGYDANICALWKTFSPAPNVLSFVHVFIARDLFSVGDMSPDPGEKITLFDASFDEFLSLASNPLFQHHTYLLPYLYEARLSDETYQSFFQTLYHSGDDTH